MSTEKRRKILLAATDIFLEKGYRLVNMQEIARALAISRPGLYLYFKTKEEIFNAVVRYFGDAQLEKAKEAVKSEDSLEAQLRKAFEIWAVEVFEQTLRSPQAKEISESSFEFARETLNQSFNNFAILVTSILRSNGITKNQKGLSSERIAYLLVSSARGFKLVAQDGAELRKMIHDLIKLLLS